MEILWNNLFVNHKYVTCMCLIIKSKWLLARQEALVENQNEKIMFRRRAESPTSWKGGSMGSTE